MAQNHEGDRGPCREGRIIDVVGTRVDPPSSKEEGSNILTIVGLFFLFVVLLVVSDYYYEKKRQRDLVYEATLAALRANAPQVRVQPPQPKAPKPQAEVPQVRQQALRFERVLMSPTCGESVPRTFAGTMVARGPGCAVVRVDFPVVSMSGQGFVIESQSGDRRCSTAQDCTQMVNGLGRNFVKIIIKQGDGFVHLGKGG